MHTVGPYSGILAYLVKIVTLTTPTHVANIANEWLPCAKQNWPYLRNQSENQISPGSNSWMWSILRADIKFSLNPFQTPEHYFFYLVCNYVVCNKCHAVSVLKEYFDLALMWAITGLFFRAHFRPLISPA